MNMDDIIWCLNDTTLIFRITYYDLEIIDKNLIVFCE